MLLLKSIHLKNFLSHSDTKIEFDSNCKLLIDGVSGSGKSSIIDALIWNFYGRGRVDNRHLIKNGSSSSCVSVILENNILLKKFLIERSITLKGKHELNIQASVSGENFRPVEVVGIKALQEYLEKNILSSTYKLFVNSIIYPQDSAESFVKQTASIRKEILLEIVRANLYDEYYKRTKESLDTTRINQSVNIEKISSLKKDIETNKEKSKDLGNLRIKKAEKIVEIETAQKTLDEVKKKKAKADYIEDKLQATRIVLNGLSNKIETSKARIVDGKKRLEEINKGGTFTELTSKLSSYEDNKIKLKSLKEIEKTANEWNSKMLELVRGKPFSQDYEFFIKGANQQLLAIMTKTVQECPELKKPCTIIINEQNARKQEIEESLNFNIEQKEKQDKILEEYDKKIKTLGDAPVVDYGQMRILEKEIEAQEKIKKEIEDYSKNSEIEKKNLEFTLSQLNLELDGCVKDQEENTIEKNKLEEELKQFPDMFRQEDVAKIKLSNLQVDLELIVGSISLAENALKMLQDDEIKLKTVEDTSKENTLNLEALELLKEAFGSMGIKAMMIDYAIPRLEDKINEVLSKLSDFRVRLDTQKSSITGDSVMEGLYINIMNSNGEVFDFGAFSGGEKVKISSAIFEGLASLQNCGFRILDESIVALDSESTTQFIETLEGIQRSVNQLIVISHIPEVKDCFEEKIMVEKINGNSKII